MPLLAWQEKFLKGLEEGRNETLLLAELKISVAALEQAKRSPEFMDIYNLLANTGAGSGVLCKAELVRLGKAQASEERAAGYFGMEVDEFRAALAADPKLDKAFSRSFMKGQAEIQIAQYEVASELKDTDMLKWYGKNYMGQSDKVEASMKIEDNTNPEKLAKMIAFLVNSGQIDYENAIDAIPITPVPQIALEKETEKSDNVLGPT